MTRRYTLLAWTAAACTYLLIVLGAVVRITGSGMGCGDHWPLCNGRLFPPLDDVGTVIEWSHRLVAAVLSVLVAALALYAWRTQREDRRLAYTAAALLLVQVILGAITVKTGLTPVMVILHLGTAMSLFAALLVAAAPGPPTDPLITARAIWFKYAVRALALVTILLGAATANLGAAAACAGFPLCNGALWPTTGGLAQVHWVHRLLAYSLAAYVVWWAIETKRRGVWGVVVLILVQVTLGAATVLLGLPPVLQAAHVAVGAAVWAGVVLET